METIQPKSAANKIKWSADPAHSEISFKVKHLMITTVTGIVKEYEINAVSAGEGFMHAEVIFKGKTASITTGNEQRDTHLKSADFFDVEKNPEITFKSSRFSKNSYGYKLTGQLTIRNVSQEITLDIEHHGLQKDPWGGTRAGFTVSGKINRTDFGLTWNTTLETGGVLVSDEVKIECEVQMIQTK
jgi:polyisoprenoid-binding protein YceI